MAEPIVVLTTICIVVLQIQYLGSEIGINSERGPVWPLTVHALAALGCRSST